MVNFEKDSTKKVIEDIMNYFYSKTNNDYFPCLINEGDLFKDGKELYLKVIAVNKNIKIDKTWMKDNLSMNQENGVFNLIVSYRYNHNSIYGINPFFLNDSCVSFVDQDNLDVLNMEYDDSSNNALKPKILLKNNYDLMMLTSLLKNYLKPKYGSADFDVYVEVEYRSYNEKINPDIIGTYFESDCAVDLLYRPDDSDLSQNKIPEYWLRFTKKIDISKLFKKDSQDIGIKVVDFTGHKIRNINFDNYNDDVEAGFVVFSGDAAEIIKQYYYFYDLVLIPKLENLQHCIVDYFDDIIVFWEGEFNSKIPMELKEKLLKYNLSDRKEQLMSKAMFNWQMQCQFDVYDDLYPNQQLANIVSKHKIDLAKDLNLDFYPPKDIVEYSAFVKNIFKLFNLNVKKLRLLKEHEQVLNDIINKNYCFDSKENMTINFYGFCYIVAKVLGYEKE